MRRSRIVLAGVLAFAVAPVFAAEPDPLLTVTPDHADGVYALNEKAVWTVDVRSGDRSAFGAVPYTARAIAWRNAAGKGASPPAPPLPGLVSNLLETLHPDTLPTEHAVVTKDLDGESPVFRAVFEGLPDGTPNVSFPAPGGEWNLSWYSGVQVEVKNVGSEAVQVGLRIDCNGDWRQSPWNTEFGVIEPGRTGTIRVRFGTSYGQPGYPVDPAHVVGAKVMVAKARQPATLLIQSLSPFKGS